MPRFQSEHFAANLRLLDGYLGLAARGGAARPAQLALAWLLAKGTHILPIPGTDQHRPDLRREPRPPPAVQGCAAQMARLEALVNPATVSGNRYNEQANREVDTEVF